MWPDERVVKFVNENFIPARVHVKDDQEAFKRYGELYNAHWTPTVLELDPNGEEFYRLEGFLPADDFLAQLKLGRAHMDFKQGKVGRRREAFPRDRRRAAERGRRGGGDVLGGRLAIQGD